LQPLGLKHLVLGSTADKHTLTNFVSGYAFAEGKYFSECQSEWKKAHGGKFVLVKGKELIGTFNRPEDAVAEGARRFGTEPFLVRSVDSLRRKSLHSCARAGNFGCPFCTASIVAKDKIRLAK
jgi:hypothetical protein